MKAISIVIEIEAPVSVHLPPARTIEKLLRIATKIGLTFSLPGGRKCIVRAIGGDGGVISDALLGKAAE